MSYLARRSVDDLHWPADVSYSDQVLATKPFVADSAEVVVVAAAVATVVVAAVVVATVVAAAENQSFWFHAQKQTIYEILLCEND
jgi:hypothetical protein